MKLDSITIESPEKIVFQYRIAKTGARMAAYLVDMFLQFLVVVLLILFFFLFGFVNAQTFQLGGSGVGSLAIAFFYLLYFFFQWGYFAFFECFRQGQSPGKRVLRIRVIKHNGEPLDVSTIVLRNLLRAVDGFPVMHFLAGIISILDKKSRRLGDIVAGTLVVQEMGFDLKEPSYETTLTSRTGLDTPLELSAKLNEQQLFIIRKFLTGRVQLSDEKRQELAYKLADQVKTATGISTPIQDPVEFLEEIYRKHSHED